MIVGIFQWLLVFLYDMLIFLPEVGRNFTPKAPFMSSPPPAYALSTRLRRLSQKAASDIHLFQCSFLGTLRPMIFFPSVKDSSGIQTYSNTLVHFQEKAHISRIDHLKHWSDVKCEERENNSVGRRLCIFFHGHCIFIPQMGQFHPLWPAQS